MYICICDEVTERDIYQAVKQGVSSFEQLSEVISVSSVCGCCKTYADQVIQEAILNDKAMTEK